MPLDTVRVPQGQVRVLTAGEGERLVVFAADPPNVLELYAPLAAALKGSARVAAFEPLGFGRSIAARGYGFTLDEQVAATAALLERLHARGAVLAFPCVSAYAALRLARERPDLVGGLALVQAPSWGQEVAWVERVDRRGLLRTPVVGQAMMALRSDAVVGRWYRAAVPDEATAHRFAAMAIDGIDHGGRFPLATAFQALFRGPPPALPQAECPALLVWGDRDRSHRETDFLSMREHAPRAKHAVLDGCGHFPELEDPKRFAATLLAWMRDEGL